MEVFLLPHPLVPYVVVAFSLAGISLGLYGRFFRGKIHLNLTLPFASNEASIAARELEIAEKEVARAEAFGVLVASRRQRLVRAGFAFDPRLPLEPGPLDLGQEAVAEIPGVRPILLGDATPPALNSLPTLPNVPAAIALLDSSAPKEEETEVDEKVLELFKEVKPVSANSVAGNRKSTAGRDLDEVRILDLLTDARWTVRGLSPSYKQRPA
jgi:hypothetical protein